MVIVFPTVTVNGSILFDQVRWLSAHLEDRKGWRPRENPLLSRAQRRNFLLIKPRYGLWFRCCSNLLPCHYARKIEHCSSPIHDSFSTPENACCPSSTKRPRRSVQTPRVQKKGKALRGQLVGSLVSQSVSQSALIALRSVVSVELLDQVDETDMWGGRKLTRRFFSQKRTPLEIPPSRSTSRRRYTPVSCS